MLKEKTVVLIGHSECFGIDEAALTVALTQLLQED